LTEAVRAVVSLLPERFRRALRNWRFIRAQRRWERLGLGWTLSSGIEVKIQSSPDWVAFCEIFVLGEYDDAIQKLLDSEEASPLVLDLGANVGYFCLRVLDRWFQGRGPGADIDIIAVEGSPSTFRVLQRRLAQSPVDSRVKRYAGLVGRRAGFNRLQENADHISTSVDNGSSSAIEVPYIDLASILPRGRRIALIKCDIEGSEADFLDCYPDLLARADNVIIEVHSTMCDVGRCHAILQEAGFRHSRHVKSAPGLTVDLFSRAVN